jgi:hypothetical protein
VTEEWSTEEQILWALDQCNMTTEELMLVADGERSVVYELSRLRSERLVDLQRAFWAFPNPRKWYITPLGLDRLTMLEIEGLEDG